VTLLLAQEELDDDRHLTRGARVRDLAQSLKALHQKDFGDLLGADEVRYDVIGTEALEPGEVQVKFGHAVYLPSAGESTLYTVSTSTDGESWHSVCPIYTSQRLALVGQDAQQASHAAPGWPFGAGVAILLVNDGPDSPIEVQVRPKGAFACSFDAGAGCYTVSRPGTPQQLWMKVERVAKPIPTPAPKPASVWKERPRAEADLTAVPVSHRPADATYAPTAAQAVTLVALALPRLSRYRETGAVSLEIGLDHTLALAPEGLEPAIRFSVDAHDRVHASTQAGRELVTLPASFEPGGAGPIALADVAPAMAERYCAMLMLPHAASAASAAVAGGARLVFGRGAPALAALRVLDAARFVQCADGMQGASADRIGLSRNAFSFEAGAGGFKIARVSATQALYHLDAQLRFVACIVEASAEQPYTLPAGHHLVAGHYVLRFDA
jgi:hypothetical protein